MDIDWDASSYGNQLIADDYFVVNVPNSIRLPNDANLNKFNLLHPDDP
ncbi:MAG TPA: hypothetical protein GXZ89_01335, partial [Fastidiosipila sp.]|nr:hypothetical protein [Fastidiosipila sp.]